MLKKLFSSVLVFCGFAADDFAQNRISDQNEIVWVSTTITPKISNRLNGYLELQWRRADWLKSWQQGMVRSGINYKINNECAVMVGYAYINTYDYGKYTIAAQPNTFGEHRIFEQITYASQSGNITFSNRLRLEQRWLAKYTEINSSKPDDWSYLNRVRYMPRIDLSINKKVYTSLYDEVFIGFGKNVGQNVFDQNRIALLAGYKFSKTFKAEFGALYQTVQLARRIDDKNVFQYNTGFILNTYFNL
ncbi:MAG: DUF2490 domain-containing protein [Arachidicoccus sp.]|nr:DUF2490 domain-containing protein [Arachidicoccus sp.]